MPEFLTADEEALRERMRRFTTEALNGERDAVIERSKQAGFFAMTQPREFGGSAASNLVLCVLRDELASVNSGKGQWVFGPGPGVLAHCEEPLRSSHLQPLLAGTKRAGFGFTEPDDAPAPTTAVRDGDALVINGQKSYVTGGGQVDFINTLVRIDDAPSLVVIDKDSPGVTVERLFASLDGSTHAAFRFDDVRVPVTHVIGSPGQGLPKAMGQIGDTRLAIAAQCVGLMRWVHGHLTDYLHQPGRGGEPRHTAPALRLRVGELRTLAYAARSMLYRTARLADAGENIVNEGAACKAFATESLTTTVDTAIQIVGGSAVVDDHPLAVLYKQIRSLRLAEGPTDTLMTNIARGHFDLGKGRI